MAQSWIPHHDTSPMQPVASARQQDIVGPGSMKPNYSVVPYQPGFPHINPPYTQNQETFSQTRYAPFTRHTIPPAFISCLKKIFKVQRSKVKDWVADGLVRADVQSLWEGTMWLDIQPLWAQLARRDKERWNGFVGEFREVEEFEVREFGNEKEWARAFGLRRDFFMEFVQSGLPYGLPPPLTRMNHQVKDRFHHGQSRHLREGYEEYW